MPPSVPARDSLAMREPTLAPAATSLTPLPALFPNPRLWGCWWVFLLSCHVPRGPQLRGFYFQGILLGCLLASLAHFSPNWEIRARGMKIWYIPPRSPHCWERWCAEAHGSECGQGRATSCPRTPKFCVFSTWLPLPFFSCCW